MKKVFSVIGAVLLILPACFSQNTSPNVDSSASFISNDFIIKIIIAIIAALLGFISNYILARRKERKESKELSYELNIKEVITKEESPIKDNISLTYRNNTVPNLTFISCTVKNTGQIVVKDEEIRFEFKDAENLIILEDYVEPKPEPELGIINLSGTVRPKIERKYKIGHLVKGKDVKFNFVVSTANPAITIHDFNPNGDVTFNELTVNKRKSQQEIIKSFTFYNILLLALYPLINSVIFSELRLDIMWGITFLIVNLNYVKPMSVILSEYFGRLIKKIDKSSFEIGGSNNIIINDSGEGAIVVDRIDFGKLKKETEN